VTYIGFPLVLQTTLSECNAGQLTTTGIADGGTTTVPVWNVVEGDIECITSSRYRDLLVRTRGLGL
jgi:hypothetical protein